MPFQVGRFREPTSCPFSFLPHDASNDPTARVPRSVLNCFFIVDTLFSFKWKWNEAIDTPKLILFVIFSCYQTVFFNDLDYLWQPSKFVPSKNAPLGKGFLSKTPPKKLCNFLFFGASGGLVSEQLSKRHFSGKIMLIKIFFFQRQRNWVSWEQHRF